VNIHAFLSALAGDWHGEEEIAASRWGQGGRACAVLQARQLFNTHLVQDYRAERDGKDWLQAHAVFLPLGEIEVQLFWFDSFGFVPAEPATGRVEGDTLTILRTSARGRTRHHYRLLSATEYALRLETEIEAGAWEPVMTGHYRRGGA